MIRAIRPDDKNRLASAFSKLDRESVYTRFFRYVTEITEQDLRRATEIDFDQELALLVTTTLGDEEIVIGAGRYFVEGTAASERGAEIAFMVADGYRRLGIASLILKHLARIGRQANLARFTASVLSANQSMLKVFAGSGLPMQQHRDGTVIEVILSLDQAGSG